MNYIEPIFYKIYITH